MAIHVVKMIKRFSFFPRLTMLALIVSITSLQWGCNALKNGWLDLTAVGEFQNTGTLEIRESLTLEDTPGVPGAEYPTREDLQVLVRPYPILPGDVLQIEIYELRQRFLPYVMQPTVSETGEVNLPVAGRVAAEGLTVFELEDEIAQRLIDLDILKRPEVTVSPIRLSAATYSLFGIGASASTNAPLRAGTFPLQKPDTRILEAINQLGGLDEFAAREIYIFREDPPRAWARRDEILRGYRDEEDSPPEEESEDKIPPLEDPQEGGPQTTERDPAELERELIDAVVRGEQPAPATRETPQIPPELEPDAVDPFIWVGDHFEPNPAYQQTTDAPPFTPEQPGFEPMTPAVDWARIAGERTYRVIRIDADALRTGDPEANVVIRPGDTIRVTQGEVGLYYIMGQVVRVGPFTFNAEQVTLKSAIASAGGLGPLAWPTRCTIYRRVGSREQMIQVNLDDIFAGKVEDFLIRRGDIINVGTHPAAPWVQILRGLTLPNPSTSVGYSFTYSRNFADIDSFAVQTNPANRLPKFPSLFP